MEQFVQIYRYSSKGRSADNVAAVAGVSPRTVDRALLVLREFEGGIDVCGGETRSDWKMPTLKRALSALEILRRESLKISARPEIVKNVSLTISKRLGVPHSRDVLEPENEVWTGYGLFGSLTQEPKLHVERKLEWRVFEDEMTESMRKAFMTFRQDLMKYGNSIKTLHRVCSSNLPKALENPSVVRSPELAKEAAVVSMLHWLLQPHKEGETYSSVARREFLPKSINTTTVRLGAWVIDTREKGVTEKLFLDLLDSSEAILKSREAERFQNNYKSAVAATDTLRTDLFDLWSN